MTENDYIYVLYNGDFGGYSMNRKFIIELFKRYPENTEIGKTIFNFDSVLESKLEPKLEPELESESEFDSDLDSEFKSEIEYFMHYKITKNKIINTETNKYYYISNHCTHLRANQFVIDFIFDRTLNKIINHNEFTPYFYNVLFTLNKDKFSNKIDTSNCSELFELNNTKQEDILNYVPAEIKSKRRNKIINKFDDNIYFYKNGFKHDDTYYKFNFDTNITKDKIYDIIKNINENILNYILFDDINDSYASLSIDKINKLYKWKISEYDGSESVILRLPTEDIIEDLLNYIWKTEKYEKKSILSDILINKTKNMKELHNDMYTS